MILGVDDGAGRNATGGPEALQQVAGERAKPEPGVVGRNDGLHLAASDMAGTVRVQATESGLPAIVRVDTSLVVPGGEEELADRVLAVCRMASTAALARQRAKSAAAGVEDGVLHRLGLPVDGGAEVGGNPASVGGEMGEEPVSWLMRA